MDQRPIAPPDPAAGDRGRAFLESLTRFTPRLWVTPAIIAANLGLFVVMAASGVDPFSPDADVLVRWGAAYGPRTATGQWWRLGSAMFLHVGLLHLAMNMWVLWSAGPLVERLLGNVGFAATYVLSGLFGGLASLWWSPNVVSAGASGAVFGVYGALLAFLLLRRRAIPLEALRGLRASTVLFLAYNLIFGLSMRGIDMAAHVGGLLGGAACGLLLSHPFTDAAWRRRWRRNLALALVGGALLVGGAYPLRQDAAVQTEIDRFIGLEQTTVERYNKALARLRTGEITDAQLARVLRREVLPAWSAVGRRGKLPPLLRRYVALREKGWRLLVQALEEHDRDKAERATRLQREAEELLKASPP